MRNCCNPKSLNSDISMPASNGDLEESPLDELSCPGHFSCFLSVTGGRTAADSMWVAPPPKGLLMWKDLFQLVKAFQDSHLSIYDCRGREISPVCTRLREEGSKIQMKLCWNLLSISEGDRTTLVWKPTNWNCSFIPSSPEGMNNSTPRFAAVIVVLQISHLHFPSPSVIWSPASQVTRKGLRTLFLPAVSQSTELCTSIHRGWVRHSREESREEPCTSCNQLFSSYNVILHGGDHLCFWKKNLNSLSKSRASSWGRQPLFTWGGVW